MLQVVLPMSGPAAQRLLVQTSPAPLLQAETLQAWRFRLPPLQVWSAWQVPVGHVSQLRPAPGLVVLPVQSLPSHAPSPIEQSSGVTQLSPTNGLLGSVLLQNFAAETVSHSPPGQNQSS